MPRQAETHDAEAARLGDELRSARLSLGLSVEGMATRLRIRRGHLEAIEEGRLNDLPGVAYAVGFVRSYASALGLDADGMTRRFRELTVTSIVQPDLVFPEPVRDRVMPTGAVMAVGAVVAICGYVAWFNWSGGGNRTVDAVPPVPPRLEQAAEQGRRQLPSRDVVPRAAEPGPVPLAALPPPGGLSASPGSGSSTSAQAATVPAVPPIVAPPAPVVAPPAAEPSAPTAHSSVAAAIPGVPTGTRIILRASDTSGDGAWIQVRDPRGGQVLVNRVLRPGEFWPVPVREGLMLDTGKANGLEILVDGQPQPTLEGLVGVRRNIALEPERLRQRLSAATASAAPAGAGPARN